MSGGTVAVENWGELKVTETEVTEGGKNGAATERSLQLVSLPKGKERGSANFLPRPLVTIPVSAIASASGTTRNDISLSLRPRASVTKGDSATAAVELSSVRFAVPNVCVGYEQTEEAGKAILQAVQDEMKAYQTRFLKTRAGGGGDGGDLLLLATLNHTDVRHEDETVVAVFDDATLSYPAGRYKIIVSNYNVILEDKKRSSAGGLVSFPLSSLQQLYLCDVPTRFAKASEAAATTTGGEEALPQYVVLILKSPIKIRATSYANIVISCPPHLVLDDTHPWHTELKTQEELNKACKFVPSGDGTEYPLTPSVSGKVSEILIRVFKAIAKVPAYGGTNKEYRTVLTQGRQCCMRCLFHGTEGLLYIVNGGFLFLHRPATKVNFADVTEVEMDEAESGSATFQLTVYAKGGGRGVEKFVFSAIDKTEKDGLLQYLGKKTKLIRRGVSVDEDDEDEEDSSSSGDTEEEAEEENDDDATSEDDNKQSHREEKRKEKHHHHHHHKRHKHHRDKSNDKEHKKHRKEHAEPA